MNRVHAIFKAILIGTAIVIPVTLVIDVTDPSRGVVAIVATVSLSVCALITVWLYESELERR